MDDKKRIRTNVTLCQTKIWLEAVRFQGGRVLASTDEDSRRIVEEHFFAIAVGQSLNWLDQVRKLIPSMHKVIERSIGHLPTRDWRDVRDMREHGDEYLGTGKGKNRQRFEKRTEDGNASLDASSTIRMGSAYLIGGRLDVHVAMNVAEELLPQIPPLMAPHVPVAAEVMKVYPSNPR